MERWIASPSMYAGRWTIKKGDSGDRYAGLYPTREDAQSLADLRNAREELETLIDMNDVESMKNAIAAIRAMC